MFSYEEFKKVWPKIVAKAWSDAAFKKKLIDSPAEVLKTYGIDLPKGQRCIINESTKETIYLMLPPKPDGQLTEEKLQQVAAGLCVPPCFKK